MDVKFNLIDPIAHEIGQKGKSIEPFVALNETSKNIKDA